MSSTVVRRGRKRLEYHVYYNAGVDGHAVQIRFGPRDRWVGNDYWYFIREYEPSRKERAFSVMARLESQNKTHLLRYWVARAVLYREIGYHRVADTHLETWRETYECDSRRGANHSE